MKQAGFTIIELMITVVIVAILAAIALPSFTYVIENNRMSSTANAVVGALNLARVEAAQRGADVTISSISGGNNWSTGYRIWFDADNSGGYTAGEEIRVFDAVSGGLSLEGGASSINFNALGFSSATLSLDLCSAQSGVSDKRMDVTLSGRVNISDINCP